MTSLKPSKVELEWSRLLGFDQVRAQDDGSPARKLKDARLAKIGSKGCMTLVPEIADR